MNVAVFPLTANVLPDGVLPLRIFEPRYLRMVAEATKNGQPIAMAMLKSNRDLPDDQIFYDIVTLCDITDFSQLEDGLLGIEVRGKALARCSNVTVDFDGLHRADVDHFEPWQEVAPESEMLESLGSRLKTIFEEYPEVGSLYASDARLDNLKWVCCRWLEILPLTSIVKNQLIQQEISSIAQYLEELFTQ